ncbi:MAG TPA: VOC family protein, partial [Chloroflexota bacterium]|nr:VOC family protein [Chloroflexota bacterium]
MPRAIRGLGEIAFRVADLDASQEFYERVVGLELMRRFPTSAFFRIAEGVAGHTQVLALFDRSALEGYSGLDRERTTVDHIAFGIELAEYSA